MEIGSGNCRRVIFVARRLNICGCRQNCWKRPKIKTMNNSNNIKPEAVVADEAVVEVEDEMVVAEVEEEVVVAEAAEGAVVEAEIILAEAEEATIKVAVR